MRLGGTAPLILVAGAVVVASCTSILGDFRQPEGTGGGGQGGSTASSHHASHASSHASSGATGGAGGAGGAAGGGGAGGCSKDTDCADPSNACLIAKCDTANQTCGTTPAPAGQPAPRQVTGDCQEIICDTGGASHTVVDHQDNDDDNPCTDDHCAGSGVHHDPRTGAACTVNGGTVCNDQGNCVECLDPGDCAAHGACTNFVCQAPTCTDGLQNQDETDEDCGGSACAMRCSNGETCNVNADCSSHICEQGLCRPAHCVNMVLDSDETDFDCGGSCAGCAVGQHCMVAGDCSVGPCQANVCRAATCSDGVHNGNETGVDCGGSCGPCASGQPCSVNGDCASGSCVNLVCM